MTPAISGHRLVASAMERIEAGALNDRSIEDLARDLKVTSRHLRRAMRAELGVSPVELSQSRRLALAKELIERSTLPMIEVAFASGFKSVRRFNAMFGRAYGRPPSRFRRLDRDREPAETVLLRLECRRAHDWPSILRSLSARAAPGVERVCDSVYCRTVRLGTDEGWVALYPSPNRAALYAEVSLSLARVLAPLVARLRRLFESGEFDGFEAAVKIILAHRVGVATGQKLLRRLVEAYGRRFEISFSPLTHLFPLAQEIAGEPLSNLARVGIRGGRARSLLALATAVCPKTEGKQRSG